MNKNISVYAIFPNRSDAEDALQQLRRNGFRPEDVSVLLPDNVGTKDIGVTNSTKAPEAAVAGGAAGATAGGVFGWLIGAGALAIPGVGPLIAAGPIMAALAGLGAGAVLGGATGALVGTGIPEYEAQRYEGRVRDGGILVSVHCDNDDWVKRAKEVLKNSGGEDLSSSKEAKADYAKSDKPRPRAVAV
jgi:hypothetical protein